MQGRQTWRQWILMAVTLSVFQAFAQAGEKMNTKKYVKPSAEELKKNLTPLQYEVTQKEGTEQPFNNAYWNHKEVGIYVDVTTGEPLFSSLDKYDSGTGWPSFTKPIEGGELVTKSDRKLFMERVEVRSGHGDNHLGHVFDDGPGPDGKRFCMNSAALRFVALKDMEKEGYGQFLPLFNRSEAPKAAPKK